MLERIDAMLDALEQYEFILDEDVAWVAVTPDELRSIPAVAFMCPIRHVRCVRYRGIEFRVSPWAHDGLQPYPVWNVSKRTKDIARKGSPQSRVKLKEW